MERKSKKKQKFEAPRIKKTSPKPRQIKSEQ